MKRLYHLLFCTITISLLCINHSTIDAQDHGFIHPGGLHTQADFDRIKRQLASGNAIVQEAYSKLQGAAYAQPTVTTNPVETIVRGGGSGENYMNAARGATMAYQNALRWKIEDNVACADAAVRILMSWAHVTKHIGGDSNYALAAGLYGYAFAQAGELMRDYDGWNSEDFETFRQWMLTVWYPSSLGFLRGRNGSWENVGRWWQAPGHYWSNWGLCNALCVASIGVLCDDVFIYNQGLSFFKYDQVGNFNNPPTLYEVTGHDEAYNGTMCLHNDGLTDFVGNLVVTDVESELETAAYGRLGQLNESGRDAGHSAMSLGLAVDMAKLGWNQGDDLFAYMDHRLASGIEYLAAQTQSIEGLPWTNYMYGSNGLYYTDGRAWLMTEPVLGSQIRPYWGTVIGIYEGVKGVKMPYSELAYAQMGIDEGAQGSTSGGYDHMGYSVLMNTRDVQLCHNDEVPTELSPKMEYSGSLTSDLIPSIEKERERGLVTGKTIYHNELGGLVNTYIIKTNTCVPTGKTITLMPQLPDGEEDTGIWVWNTGATTRNITIQTNKSYIYRVTYTNSHGIDSQLSFPIAVAGDGTADTLSPYITYNGMTYPTDTLTIVRGSSVTLHASPSCGWGTFRWANGNTNEDLTTSSLTSDSDFSVRFTNQSGMTTDQKFHIKVIDDVDDISIEGIRYLYNPYSGKFLFGSNDWGTQASLGETGVDFTISVSGNGYTLDSKLNNGGSNQYLGPDLYLDNIATTWSIAFSGTFEGKRTYTVTTDGSNYLAAPTSGNVVVGISHSTDRRAQWVLYSHEELLAKMSDATPSTPMNVTFLLPGYNFSRNDTRNSNWQGDPAIGGDNKNLNAEKFNTTFDVYQELTDIPNGTYEVSVQAFYRYGGHGADIAVSARTSGTEVIHASFYANGSQTPVLSIFDCAGQCGEIGISSSYGYVPNSQSDASAYMSADLYWSQPLRVNVSDGTLRLGITKSTTVTYDWTLFDNFRLVYLGSFLIYDINHDGLITIGDVSALINIILGKDSVEPYIYDHTAADINKDGSITVSDISALIKILLNK